MLQQIIALAIVGYFLTRLFKQKNKKQISGGEFVFWFLFWLLLGVMVIGLKLIDRLVFNLGFSASGINVLLYLGVAALFYFFFKIRLRQEKIERDITEVVRELAIAKKEK